ncbi:hypothetical protein GCM10017559_84030 [Streptosporangium longisporum]|uniref:Non-ribosomal peptide synthetase n=1 Tax=Streptosporangium longisporum TaxID=46187 RepID=A0ABP6LI86_9ACTN
MTSETDSLIGSVPVPASLAQQGIWFNERMGGTETVYTMPFSVSFDGPLDVTALAAAWRALVARHPALTRAVSERQGVPYLTPAAEPPGLRVVETGADRPGGPVTEEILHPFDLTRGPLLRGTLYVEGPRRATLLVVVHHLVFDGESTSVFLRDLAALYRAEVTGAPAGLPEAYGDDPRELAARAEARVAASLSFAREFWGPRRREAAQVVLPGLTGEVPAVDRGAAVRFDLPAPEREALARLSEEIGASRFEIVLASLHALLYRYGNAEPTVAVDLGTRSPETRDQIGAFVNELPVTARLRPEWGFRRFVGDQRFAYGLRSDLRGLFRVREVPLSRAVSGVRPGVSLAPISLGYRRREAAPEFHGVGAHVEWVLFNHTVRGAMRAHIVDGPDRFGVVLQYNPRLMTGDDAERVAEHWRTLLAAVAADPDLPIAELPLLGEEETRRLLSEWNDTAVAYPSATLPELLAEQAARTPEAVAAVCGARTMSYAELAGAVDGLASRLRALGVRRGTLVAVCAGRSLPTLVTLLAVSRAGGAYLPLDPDHPIERLRLILEDSGAGLLLTGPERRDDLAGAGVRTLDLTDLTDPTDLTDLVDLTDPTDPADLADPTDPADPTGQGSRPAVPAAAVAPPPWPEPGDPAYVLHTSGSTGRPKGVRIPHRALTNLLLAMRDLLGSAPGDRWLALTSLSFDISALELYLPLVTGGRVVLAPDGALADGRELVRLAAGSGVTHVQATPSGWRMLLDAGLGLPGATALAGGEALPRPAGPGDPRRDRQAVQRLRAHRDDDLVHQCLRRRARHHRAHRRAAGQHPGPRAGRAAAAAPGGRARRALHRRGRRRRRLPRPARADRGTLPRRPVRARPPLPDGRPRPQALRRARRVHRPPGRPDQAPRPPHRTGRDRVPAAGAPRRGPRGRRRQGGRQGGAAPGRLPGVRDGTRRPARALRRHPALVHDPRRRRRVARAADDRQRQARPGRPARARGPRHRARHDRARRPDRGGRGAARDLAGGARRRGRRPRRGPVRAGRPLADDHPDRLQGPAAAGRRPAAARLLRRAHDRRDRLRRRTSHRGALTHDPPLTPIASGRARAARQLDRPLPGGPAPPP